MAAHVQHLNSHISDAHLMRCCRAEQISSHPRAYVYHNFLSPEECDHIVALAKPQVGKPLLSMHFVRLHICRVSHSHEH